MTKKVQALNQGILVEVFITNDGYCNVYVQKGGTIVNYTFEEITEGTELSDLYDIDTFTWRTPIVNELEFRTAVGS